MADEMIPRGVRALGSLRGHWEDTCPSCGHRPEGDGVLVARLLSAAHLDEAGSERVQARIRDGESIRPSRRMLDTARRALGKHFATDQGLSARDAAALFATNVLLTRWWAGSPPCGGARPAPVPRCRHCSSARRSRWPSSGACSTSGSREPSVMAAGHRGHRQVEVGMRWMGVLGSVACTGEPLARCPDALEPELAEGTTIQRLDVRRSTLTGAATIVGGCPEDTLEVCFAGGFMESKPVQSELRVVHTPATDEAVGARRRWGSRATWPRSAATIATCTARV